MEKTEYQIKRIKQVSDDLINNKMDEDLDLLREDAELMVNRLRNSLRVF